MRVPLSFVIKPTSVDTHAICVVVPALHHKVRNNPVEAVALVMMLLSLLASAEAAEILSSERNFFGE